MTFDEYKERVSIIQILEDLGYVPDASKGRVTPVYVKIMNGKKIDEIMVKNPNSLPNQVYYDRNYQGGDVISFIKNHLNDFSQYYHNNQYIHINRVLRYYSKNTYTPKYQNFKFSKEKIPFEIERYQQLKATIQDLQYLVVERQISTLVVERFLPFIVKVKDTLSQHKFSNIGFPYRELGVESGQITNFEMKNYGFSGMAEGGDKTNSAWAATFDIDKYIKNVFIFESAIDAMSFYDLYQQKINFGHSCFCSVGGYITNSQITRILKTYPRAQIHTCFDNDLAGVLYDIRVHSILMNYELKYKKEGDSMVFQIDNRAFRIPNKEVTLERLSQEVGDVILFKIHKADSLYKDFNEELQHRKKGWRR